jgi:hypothetical protein
MITVMLKNYAVLPGKLCTDAIFTVLCTILRFKKTTIR